MALTSSDETDLLLPLMSAAGEIAPFSSFLERLRRRAGAVSARINIRLADGRSPLAFFAGPDLRQRSNDLGLEELSFDDRIRYDRLRPGRVYSGDEFDDHDALSKARRIRDMRKLGLVDERVVRLLDDPAASAWLILAKDRPCTAADSALLSNLAPYIASMLRHFIAGSLLKLIATADADGLDRAGTGWIVFNKAAGVISLSPGMSTALSDAIGLPPTIGQRLRALGLHVDRALTSAAAAFAQDETGPDRTLVLCHAPRIDAILSPLLAKDAGLLDGTGMIAHCRYGRPAHLDERAAHFARLYDLPRREAELAIRLADGRSLGEAGAAMGLTIETTRNYSKRLFGKVGVRGQAELVRAVYESCAVLA